MNGQVSLLFGIGYNGRWIVSGLWIMKNTIEFVMKMIFEILQEHGEGLFHGLLS
jgi:hypothetical protein